MKKIVFFLLLWSFSFHYGQTKQEKIKNLLELTGSANLGIKFMNDFVVYFKQAYPTAPNEFWDKFMNEVKPEDLQNLIIPIYDSNFTEKEVDDFIAFYKSPSGQKMASKLPQIYAESQEAGGKWGQELAEKVVKELELKNYSSPPPAMETKLK